MIERFPVPGNSDHQLRILVHVIRYGTAHFISFNDMHTIEIYIIRIGMDHLRRHDHLSAIRIKLTIIKELFYRHGTDLGR